MTQVINYGCLGEIPQPVLFPLTLTLTLQVEISFADVPNVMRTNTFRIQWWARVN